MNADEEKMRCRIQQPTGYLISFGPIRNLQYSRFIRCADITALAGAPLELFEQQSE